MDKELHKMLKDSALDKIHYKEVDVIFRRLLNEKYKQEVVVEALLHQANFDKDVFLKYWFQQIRLNDKPTCNLWNEAKATKIGFDRESIFGNILVGLVDYYFDKETTK